jgi:hypothetical protein
MKTMTIVVFSFALLLTQSGGAIAQDRSASTMTLAQDADATMKLQEIRQAQSYPECPANKPATAPCRCYSGLVYKICGAGQTCVENAQCVP